MARNNNSIYLKEKAAKKRHNDLKFGKHYKNILKENNCLSDENSKSDLYYKKGNIGADEEREFCGKVTKSKYNGFNPKFSEKKKYENIREQLEDYENNKLKKWVIQRIDYKDDSEDLSIEEFYSENNMTITDEMVFDYNDYDTAEAYYILCKPFGDYRLVERKVEV